MSEKSPKPTPEEAQQDPAQRALERFERQIASPKYSMDALERALKGVERVGGRIWSSPGEMYVGLAQLSQRLAENAQKHGEAEGVARFSDTKEQFRIAGELIARQPEGPAAQSKPSSPRRTTGRASG